MIRVGTEVSVQHKGQRRRGVVVRESDKRSSRKPGKFWWLKLHGAENLHLCRNVDDIKAIT